ncbi:MAG: ATPase [Caldithrix sp.]|nr:ATPase [Caldithrix sp.]
MKKVFAIPTENGQLCMHFGHCEKFAIVETENNQILREHYLTPPTHQPGVYPRFLAEKGVHTIISGSMGQKAQQLFDRNHIEVCVGVNADTPKKLVEQYLKQELQTGQNQCGH